MKLILVAVALCGMFSTTANAQSLSLSDTPGLLVATTYRETSALLEPEPPVIVNLALSAAEPDPIIKVNPAPPPTPCPGGVGKPCAMLAGRAYFPDLMHSTEHDKTWVKAMSHRGMLIGAALLIGADFADYKTTRNVIDNHCGREGNPLMGQSRGQQISVGIGLDLVDLWLVGKLKQRGSGNVAFALLAAGASNHIYWAARNWSISNCHN